MRNWFKSAKQRHLIGGRKDDARIDGVVSPWPRPQPYSLVQKVALGLLIPMLLVIAPVYGVLVLTGLITPVERYLSNDATQGMAAEVSSWWQGGGTYLVVLNCPAPSHRPLFSDIATADETEARRKVQTMQPDCTVDGVHEMGRTILNGHKYRVRMMCLKARYRTSVTTSGANIDAAADFAMASIPGCTRESARRLCKSGRRIHDWNCQRELKSYVASQSHSQHW